MRLVKSKPREEIFEPEVAPELPEEPEIGVFGEDAPAPVALVPPVTQIDVPDIEGLTEKDRKELADALRAELPVAVRAKLLARLAQFKDTKRAAVGLKAIQVINELTGVTEDRARETTPMFMLPEDAAVAVTIEKVEK